MSVKISGTGRALPERFATNNDLAAFLNTTDEWIVSKTGIKQRGVITTENLTDLAAAAGLDALADSGLALCDINYLICTTVMGDNIMPSLACTVAEKLGLTCPAYDMNVACSGFVFALDIAAAYIESKRARHVLIISAEAMSRHVDWEDRTSCILFGDGAAAAVISPGNALKYMHLSVSGNKSALYQTFGTGNTPFAEQTQRGHLTMDGHEIFKFAVTAIENEINLALKATSLKPQDVDYYVLHQANKRIIDSARKRLSLESEKFPVNIDKYGNTSSVTIPLLLDEIKEQGLIKPGVTVVLVGFGAGLTTCASVLKWE